MIETNRVAQKLRAENTQLRLKLMSVLNTVEEQDLSTSTHPGTEATLQLLRNIKLIAEEALDE